VNERHFRTLIEMAPDAVWINDGRRLVFANPAAVRMLGYPDLPSLLAADPRSFVHPDDREAMRERTMEMFRSGQSIPPRDYRVRHRDGRWVLTEVHSMPIDWEGAPAILGFARDITAKRAMEAQLGRADRLAALGTLLAGIAHEVNNPLAYAVLGLEQADDCARRFEGPESERLRALLGEVRSGMQRVAAVVRQLRATMRSEPESSVPVDLGQVLASTLRMAGNEIRHRVKLGTAIEPDLPRVQGNATRLEQVFLNLVINALQALPDGRPDNELTVSAWLEGPSVIVEVRDNGPGIPSEVLPRVFDPFFTTKPVGLGMGLGLSICHGIVSAHGGTITVESEPGRTTFRVTLPAAEGRAALPSPPEEIIPASGRGRRVLVVDDEPGLSETIARLLAHDNQVEVSTSAREALERISAGAAYDVILCDLMMPAMTGIDLHAALAELHPGLEARMIFMTGGAFTARAEEFLARVTNPCIYKPFDGTSLRSLVSSF
jgi:two-component system cell cycle sensor histidine kinase/response regulator CckA